MSIQRDAIPFGPGKIVSPNGDTFYSAGDIDVQVITKWADVKPDQYGPGVKTVLDRTIEVTFKPQSIYALMDGTGAKGVYPATHIAPTALGGRIIGGTLPTTSVTSLVIHGEDSSLLTVFCPALVGIPTVMLGIDKGEFGTMKYIGVVTNGKDVGDASGLYTYAAAGGTYGTPGVPDYLSASEWQFTWHSSALSGTMLEAVTITPDFKYVPVMAGPRTMDFRFDGVQFSASVVAAIDSVALSTFENAGSTGTLGQRNTAVGGDLVFSSALGNTFTLKTSAIEKYAKKYDMKGQRARAIDFRTAVLSGARISWT